jgi:hypothetical protein
MPKEPNNAVEPVDLPAAEVFSEPEPPINLALFVVEGTDEALDLLQQALPIKIDIRWKKGEATRQGGQPRRAAGLSATINESADPHEILGAIRTFVTGCKNAGLQFDRPDLFGRLSINVEVGSTTREKFQVEFTPSDFVLLAQIRLPFAFSAYASD